MVELPQRAKVMIYVFGLLDGLAKKGMIGGGTHRITDEGRRQYEALKATGFEPTPEEIHEAMAFLQSQAKGAGNG